MAHDEAHVSYALHWRPGQSENVSLQNLLQHCWIYPWSNSTELQNLVSTLPTPESFIPGSWSSVPSVRHFTPLLCMNLPSPRDPFMRTSSVWLPCTYVVAPRAAGKVQADNLWPARIVFSWVPWSSDGDWLGETHILRSTGSSDPVKSRLGYESLTCSADSGNLSCHVECYERIKMTMFMSLFCL